MSTKDINYYQEKIKRVNKIGVMISKEKDIDKLMNLILEESVLLTNSDAGSIYFKEKINNKDYLVFKHSVNRSSNLNYKGESIAINEQSVSGLAALNGETIIVKKDNLSEYPVDTSFDKENNFKVNISHLLDTPLEESVPYIFDIDVLYNAPIENKSEFWTSIWDFFKITSFYWFY